MTTRDYHWVETTEQLAACLTQLTTANFIAIDTEFVRRTTYHPVLCLVQMMTDQGQLYLVDAYRLPDLTLLWQCLESTPAVKVFHDSRQDLEIVWYLSGGLPSPLFDTQLAALLLGYGESCGFARLVEGELGVSLAKDQTASDWCHRPLSEAQIQYAIDDVLYLAQLYPLVKQKLADQHKLEWLVADHQAMTDPQLYQADITSLRKKVKAPPFFTQSQRARLDALLLWREEVAISLNRPRQWIADNTALLKLAERQPRFMGDLSKANIPAQTLRQYGQSIIALLASPPHYPEAPKLPEIQQHLMKSVRSVIDQLAEEYHLRQSSVLASKEDLTWWLHTGVRPERLSKGWRNAVLTQEGVDLLVQGLHQDSQLVINFDELLS
jgi:ribonuclease D